jgi:hypothetical protein
MITITITAPAFEVETYLDILGQNMPGVALTLKYDAPDDKPRAEITASW